MTDQVDGQIEAVPGDDWIWRVDFQDADGNPEPIDGLDFVDWRIEWRGGSIALTEANGRITRIDYESAVIVEVPRSLTPGVPRGESPRLVMSVIDEDDKRFTYPSVPIVPEVA